MKFNTKEMAIMNFTMALTFNSKEIRTLLTVEEAILVYEHTKEMLQDSNLLLNQYKAIHTELSENGKRVITVFEF